MVIVEPSAESLALAHDTFDQYAAFVRAGFSKEQSANLVAVYLSQRLMFSFGEDYDYEDEE